MNVQKSIISQLEKSTGEELFTRFLQDAFMLSAQDNLKIAESFRGLRNHDFPKFFKQLKAMVIALKEANPENPQAEFWTSEKIDLIAEIIKNSVQARINLAVRAAETARKKFIDQLPEELSASLENFSLIDTPTKQALETLNIYARIPDTPMPPTPDWAEGLFTNPAEPNRERARAAIVGLNSAEAEVDKNELLVQSIFEETNNNIETKSALAEVKLAYSTITLLFDWLLSSADQFSTASYHTLLNDSWRALSGLNFFMLDQKFGNQITLENTREIEIQHQDEFAEIRLAMQPTKISFEVHSIIRNLINNALDHAFEGIPVQNRKLAITAHIDQAGYYQIKCKDNGRGMTIDKQADVFVVGKTTRAGNNGVALSTIKDKLSQYDSQISFESTVGEGTTFTIVIDKKFVEKMIAH